MLRGACIDIGTNTTRLLVAERDPARPGMLRTVHRRRAVLPVTAAERLDGLPEEKLAALCAELELAGAEARAHGAGRVRVVATAALREMPGREALVARLAGAAGGPVAILPPEEEAGLAFAGATAGMDPAEGTVAVVDAGGGSTEIAAGVPGAPVHWWRSAPVGSAVLTDLHLVDDPPTAEQLDRARRHAAEAIEGLGCPGADVAWAAGGTTSLARLIGAELSAGALARAQLAIAGVPCAQAAAHLDLDVARARLLPAALVVLEAVVTVLGCAVRLGEGGLREGVVLDLLREME